MVCSKKSLPYLNIKGKIVSIKSHSVMGIINVCSDSFYKNSQLDSLSLVLKKCEQMIKDGASFIDLGSVSSKPGSAYPGADEEITRLLRFFPVLRKEFPEMLFSIDTWNSKVAKVLLDNGADIINDISAGTFDKLLPEIVSEYHCPYIIMHTPAMPDKMNDCTKYDDIVGEINLFFSERIHSFHQMGITDLIIDPGFGFGKTLEQNYCVLKNLKTLSFHERPILVGMSRKSMLYNLLKIDSEKALNATSVVNAVALMNGADILRVHDVAEAVEAVKIIEALS